MNKSLFLVLVVILVLCLDTNVFGQMSYAEQFDHFATSWEKRVGDWKSIRNIHYCIYSLAAILSIVSGVLSTMKKGPTWLTATLAILLGISTQVSWLFNVQPRKFQWAVDKVTAELENFKSSVYGADLSKKNVGMLYLNEKEKLRQQFEKIQDWLIGENNSIPAPPELKGSVPGIRISYREPLVAPECLFPNFSFATGSIIQAGTFKDDIPETLYKQIEGDAGNLYLIGLAKGPNPEEATIQVQECIRSTLFQFFLLEGDSSNPTNSENATRIASGVLDISEEVWFRVLVQEGQTYSLRIRRIPKSTLLSYFSSVNQVTYKEPQERDAKFLQKVQSTKIIQ